MQGSNILRWLPRLRVEPGISNKIDQGRSLMKAVRPSPICVHTKMLEILAGTEPPGVTHSLRSRDLVWPQLLLYTGLVATAHPRGFPTIHLSKIVCHHVGLNCYRRDSRCSPLLGRRDNSGGNRVCKTVAELFLCPINKLAAAGRETPGNRPVARSAGGRRF